MATLTPTHYRLLSGPYRMAVWAILSRFKAEFVRQCVDAFMVLPPSRQKEIGDLAQQSLIPALSQFVDDREAYESILAECIAQLLQTNTALTSKLQPKELARIRCIQIEEYLHGTISLWCQVRDRPDPDSATKAIAQSIWPYYCITYLRNPHVDVEANVSPWNFATWIAGKDIQSIASFSRLSKGNVSRTDFRLCPSIDACFVGIDNPLGQLLDVASDAPLDFDHPESNFGHVQTLRFENRLFSPDTTVISDILAGMHEPAKFTDLFYFVRHAVRYLIFDRPEDENARPIGVLFLAGPSLGSIGHIFGISQYNDDAIALLEAPIAAAWNAVGGRESSQSFFRDFSDLRAQFNEVENIARTRAGIDTSHTSKNILVNISGMLTKAIKTAPGPGQDDILFCAQQLAYFVGQDFGLQEKLLELTISDDPNLNNILTNLSDTELFEIVRGAVKWLLTIRQVVDRGFGRTYSYQNEPINENIEPLTVISEILKDIIMASYKRLKMNKEYEELKKSLIYGLEKNPISLAVFLTCRELVDNMRPRVDLHRNTRLEVQLEEPTSVPGRSWREIKITQRVTGKDGENPFAGAHQADSIVTFNERFGENQLGLAEIECQPSFFDVSLRQWVFTVRLLYPGAQTGKASHAEEIGHGRNRRPT